MQKMDKEKVLNKIKKCLALGKSANEHEAAGAGKNVQLHHAMNGTEEMKRIGE